MGLRLLVLLGLLLNFWLMGKVHGRGTDFTDYADFFRS